MATIAENVIRSSFSDTPDMPELKTSNHLLGDRAALDAAWKRDGYWFFRDVLDKDAVASVRAEYLDVLGQLGVIEPGHTDAAVYNGASLDNYPIYMGGDSSIDPLFARYPMTRFVADPRIKPVFEAILGDEVVWVPNSEFQAVPPRSTQESRFNYVHNDGANNKGLNLRVCWIPLATIDESTGGLAIGEGLNRPRMGDFPRPFSGIKLADVPADSWRRAEYNPGDLLIFSLETPHSGLANRSDRFFRLSMDVRCVCRADKQPVIGTLKAVDRCAITVETSDGTEQVFRIDQDTFYRLSRGRLTGTPLELEEIPQLAKVGDRIYLAEDHGTATFVRPQH